MAADSPRNVQSAVHLLHRAGQRADDLFAKRARGLSPRQYEILKAVSHADGLSQTAITNATGIDRSSTAAFVARMVRSGLLQRRRTKRDSRTYAVRLTPKGRQTFEATEPLARAADDALMAALSGGQKANFLDALERVAISKQR